ncbi:hypothetical protein B0C18_003848 [Salmonella enterica]|nr:hypothetical protein [Salmonella enterica]EHV9142494.1 hypothetical protein [Salmonella enterica]
MKKLKFYYVLISTAAILSGCSGNNQTEFSSVTSAADQCTSVVHSSSLGKNGKTTLRAIKKIDSYYVRVGDSTTQFLVLEDIPYVESEMLDNGVPGSAWRRCMQEKGIIFGSKS